MKKIALILTGALCALAMGAKGRPDIQFNELKHDFGYVKEADGKVKFAFVYHNTGDAPLAVNSVSAPCSCTSAKFSSKPVAPGDSAVVNVTFDPKGMGGGFIRSISVWTNVREDNGKKKKLTLQITGVVIPK